MLQVLCDLSDGKCVDGTWTGLQSPVVNARLGRLEDPERVLTDTFVPGLIRKGRCPCRVLSRQLVCLSELNLPSSSLGANQYLDKPPIPQALGTVTVLISTPGGSPGCQSVGLLGCASDLLRGCWRDVCTPPVSAWKPPYVCFEATTGPRTAALGEPSAFSFWSGKDWLVKHPGVFTVTSLLFMCRGNG